MQTRNYEFQTDFQRAFARRFRRLIQTGTPLLLLVLLLGCGPDTEDPIGDDDDVTGDDDDVTGDDDTTGDDDDTTGDDDDTVTAPTLEADPAELSFGVVAVDEAYTDSFELRAIGEDDVTISATVLSGANTDVFSIGDLADTVIEAGDSLVVDVQYEPTEPATHYAEVVVQSDGEPSVLTVLLSGTAQLDILDVDNDGDGYSENDGDCDDADPDKYPGAPELCNDEDDDCDGLVPADESEDLDGDGAIGCEDCDDADPAMNLVDGDFDGWSTCTGDCDDTTSTVSPGAMETCNGVDDDCDGNISPDEFADDDVDGYLACEDCDDNDAAANHDDVDGDYATTCDGDCDDFNPQVYPGAIDTPGDGVDSNCDGID